MTLFTSGDWIADKDREITFGVFEFMCNKLNQLFNATVEVNQVDLTNEFGCGFCQVDEDGGFSDNLHDDEYLNIAEFNAMYWEGNHG